MLHVADERCRELIAESDLGKDVGGLSLDGNKLINHRDLLSIEGEFALVNSHALPEILHFLLDDRADLSDAVHFLQRRLHALRPVHLVQLLYAPIVGLVIWVVHTTANLAQSS